MAIVESGLNGAVGCSGADEGAVFVAELAELLGRDELRDPAEALDGLDSLERLDLLDWIAQRGVVVELAALTEARTVGALRDLYVAARGTQEAAPPPADPPPGILRTPFFQLEPINADVMPYLYQLAVSSDVGYRWRFRGAVPDYPTFESTFWQGSLAQLVAIDLRTELPAGHVVCYNPDPGQGYAYLGAVFAPEYAGDGRSGDAVRCFVRYVFTTWSFRKLYMEVPGFNYPQIASGEGEWFDVEGRLRGHDYYGGRWWDHHTLAVYRRHVGFPALDPA